ncbi:FAD-binding oxidoreductase [soil metagenome]
MNRTVAGVFWIVLYLFVVLAPLFLMMIRPTPPERSFWVEVSLGLGFVGLVQIAVQFALIARFPEFTAPYGIDLILRYHKQIAVVAIVLLVAHPIILVIDQPSRIGMLNPLGGSWATRTGNWALYTLLLLAVLSLFRKQIKLNYELWRVTHALLGVAAVVLAHVHVNLAGRYTETPWKEVVHLTVTLFLLFLFGYLRLVKPAMQRRHRYRVAEVRRERGSTWSLALESVGHEGLRFSPGQFAWIKLGGSPYKMEEHPFSFSSNANDHGRIEFGIKELGDFTSRIGDLPVDTVAYVDGPHGNFSIDVDPAAGYVFLAGGIGITPFMSMLRTMAERRDKRPVLLLYGDKAWDAIAFREEIEALRDRLALDVVFVLEEVHDGWEGETGFIDADMIRRHLPEEGIERLYFVCGPEPLLVAAEAAILETGVPLEHIRSERFDLV